MRAAVLRQPAGVDVQESVARGRQHVRLQDADATLQGKIDAAVSKERPQIRVAQTIELGRNVGCRNWRGVPQPTGSLKFPALALGCDAPDRDRQVGLPACRCQCMVVLAADKVTIQKQQGRAARSSPPDLLLPIATAPPSGTVVSHGVSGPCDALLTWGPPRRCGASYAAGATRPCHRVAGRFAPRDTPRCVPPS